MIERQLNSDKKFDILPLLKLIKKHFEPMLQKYKWGINPYYYLAGKYGIHPTYIQRMLTNFDDDEIISAINQLKLGDGKRYNSDLARLDYQKPIKLIKGKWSPPTKIKNREVLILAAGPQANDYKKELEKYIKLKKPFVIALNTVVNIDKRLINVFAACHPMRMISDIESYKSLSSPLVIPISLLSDSLKSKFKNLKLLNFGIGVKENSFQFHKTEAVIPRLYAVAYALSIATSGNASRILLAGFDGYKHRTDERHKKITDHLFSLYSSCKGSKPLMAITPTSYAVKSTSIYVL